jgi:hypothetical protein
MATATPTRPSPVPGNLAQEQTRIRGPLDSLRSYIRAYVTLEGVATVLLFLAAWFWIGLALDWGMFKLLGADIVQELHWSFRLVVLIGLTGGLIALLVTTVLVRLLVQFSDVAVALVLEKMFPKLLGDRLITAVELNDPAKAAAHGYSADMVRQTIHEASEAVDKVPVKDAFAWKRLITRGVFIVLTTLGLYLLAGAAFVTARGVEHDPAPVAEGVADLNEISGIWIERNILLQDVIWPRRSHIEIISHGEVTRLPKKSRPDRLVAVAWKYVIADRHAHEGLRQMAWDDVEKLLKEVSPELPQDWADRNWLKFVKPDPEKKQESKWLIAVPGDVKSWRPLLWKDLTRERLRWMDVPGVPAAWIGSDEGGLVKAEQVSLSVDAIFAQLKKNEHPELHRVRDRLNRLQQVKVDEVDSELNAFPVRATPGAKNSWEIADDSDDEWRPLQWKDLTKERVGGYGSDIPAEWVGQKGKPVKAALVNLSADEVYAKLQAAKGVDPKMLSEPTKKMLSDLNMVFARLNRLNDLRETREKLDELLAQRSMKRTARKLIVPSKVRLVFWNAGTTKRMDLDPEAGNKFTSSWDEIDETTSYRVSGEDYVTRTYRFDVVERPQLEEMQSIEEHPAYLYYRPDPKGPTAQFLAGKLQPIKPIDLSVTGESTTVDVPTGSTVTIRAVCSKPLKTPDGSSIVLVAEGTSAIQAQAALFGKIDTNRDGKVTAKEFDAFFGKRLKKLNKRNWDEHVTELKKLLLKDGALGEKEFFTFFREKAVRMEGKSAEFLEAAQQLLPEGPDGELNQETDREFTFRLENVRMEQRFKFRFTDSDDVTAERRVIINPREDRAPSIADFNPDEVIRSKDKGRYIVTAKARIPFRARIRDDNGLRRVRYMCVVSPADGTNEDAAKEAGAKDGVHDYSAGVGLAFIPDHVFGTMMWSLQQAPLVARHATEAADVQANRHTNYVELRGFINAMTSHRQRPPEGDREDLPDFKLAEFLSETEVLKQLKIQQRPGFRKLYSEHIYAPDKWDLEDRNIWPKDRISKERPVLDNWRKVQAEPLLGDLGLWQLRWRDEGGMELPLLAKPDEPEKSFTIEVTLQAEDTALDTDKEGGEPRPNVTTSRQTFFFDVVPESMLLGEIRKEEAQKSKDLARAHSPLPDKILMLSKVRADLRDLKPEELVKRMPVIMADCDQLDEALKASQADAKTVYEAYTRIVREMRLNQINEEKMIRTLRLHKPMGEMDPLFTKTLDSLADLRKRLGTPATNEERLARATTVYTNLVALEKQIRGILDEMASSFTYEELVNMAKIMKKNADDSSDELKKLHNYLMKKFLGIDDEKPKEKEPKKGPKDGPKDK